MTNIITEKKQTIDIPEGKQKERIDSFLTQAIENSTRSKVQKLIKAGFRSEEHTSELQSH